MSDIAPRMSISKSTYNRHKREITRLRAENKRLRTLLDGRDNFIVANGLWHDFVKTLPPKPTSALEGVTEQSSPWLDIESAPKDGTPVEGSELYRYLPYKPEGRRQMKADGRWQRWNGYGWEKSEPPQKWKPADKSTEPHR